MNGIRQARRRCFCCVNDGVPKETLAQLRRACGRRAIAYREVDAATFDFDPRVRLRAGDLLFRPAISLTARRVEQFLYAPGVLTFHAEPSLIYYDCLSSTLVLERAGLPVPRTEFCVSNLRVGLRRQVARLGGLPVVAKAPGGSGGVGVMRADSFATLFSLVDFLLAHGHAPLLSEYVPGAVHWRVIVVGNRAVAWYRNPIAPDDFRSYARGRRQDHPARLRPALRDAAVAAVRALRLEFGGVDLLEGPDRRLHVLEANFPCAFAEAQEFATADIALAMIDHLLAKGRAPSR